MSNESVNVLNPDGELVSLPITEAREAVTTGGYKIPNAQDVQGAKDKADYGNSPVSTFLESAASGATGGVSRQIENRMGLTTPEAQRKRYDQNSAASGIGEPVGVFGSLLLGNESAPVKALSKFGSSVTEMAAPYVENLVSKFVNPESSPIISKILNKAGAHAIGSGVEGAVYGAGESIKEDALGDPDAMGEKLVHNIGFGSALGGGFGAVLGPLARDAKPLIKQTALQDSIAEGAASANAEADQAKAYLTPQAPDTPFNPDAAPTADAGQDLSTAPFKDMPGSLADIQKAVGEAGPLLPEGMPQRGALQDAVKSLPDLQFKPNALQYESLEDPAMRDYYKTFLETDSPEAKALRDYEALQKQEGVAKLNSDIQYLSPTKTVTGDAVSAGDGAVKAFTDQYDAEKKALAPAFKQFDELAKSTGADAGNVILKLQDANLGFDAEKLIQIDENGKFKIDPYSADVGITKEAHGALKDLLKTLNKEDVTISQLRNVRESMRNRINMLSSGGDRAQIEGIRKVLMDEMQERVGKIGDESLRETFKRFAVNEEERSTIEKIFGGSISDRASFGKTIKPEDVIDRMFSNTVSVKAAKNILGSQFDQILADYLHGKSNAFTDNAKNGFSSQKWATFLRNKGPELGEAFAEKPDQLKRLSALGDYMRILPDSPSVNPSGTAKTLNVLSRMQNIVGTITNPRQALMDFADHHAQKLEVQKQTSTIDQILKGQKLQEAQASVDQKSQTYSALGRMERAGQSTSNAIKSIAKGVLSGTDSAVSTIKSSSGYLGSKIGAAKGGKAASQDSKKDVIAQLNELNNNPEKMIDHLDEITKGLAQHAPNVASSVQMSMTRGIQFLQSKVPQMPPQKPLSKPLEPSRFEMAKFERYYNAVQDPVSVLKLVQGCAITPESLEAVQTVYPKLYQEMTSTLMEEMNNKVAKDGAESIPYKTKMGLSMFLGQDLDHTLDQQAIAANQFSLATQGQAQANNDAKVAQKTSQSGLSKIKAGPGMLTAAQASAQRPTS